MLSKPFSPKDIRKACNLTEHELRKWRGTLPPYCNTPLINGQDPGFTNGELVAFKTIEFLVKRVGIQVQKLCSVSEDIFRYCTKTNWQVIRQEQIEIQFDVKESTTPSICFMSKADTFNVGNMGKVVLLFDMALIIQEVELYLLTEGYIPNTKQLELNYPTAIVASGREAS